MSTAVTWQEVECGSYVADLALWEDLASAVEGPVLELGCGVGRVTLHLAALGREVVGVDADPALTDELNARAADAGVPARAVTADAASFELGRRFDLVLAPMQLMQILGGGRRRRATLERVAAHLAPGGMLAAAIVEPDQLPDPAAGGDCAAPLPDVKQQDGWVFSSLPVAVRRAGQRVEIERLRQAVSPAGEISEAVDITGLDPLSPGELASDARGAGLILAATREVVATHWHVGSTVCLIVMPR